MIRFSPAQRSGIAIAAATAVNLPFGTIYAFSVFLKPMEAMLAISRAEMTMVFGLSTISLTVGMNIAPRLYRILSPVALLIACGVTSALGLYLTASATNLAHFAIGYGVLFGLGGGCGFIVVQQGANQTITKMSGLANGYIVSLFPLGAMIGAPLFGWAIEAHGLRATMMGLAVVIATTATIAAGLIRLADIRMHDASVAALTAADRRPDVFIRLFAVFFLAAAAGLMVMSQAAGIIQAYGGKTLLALAATTMITGAIAAARIGGGWLVDRYPMPVVAAGAHLFSLTGALMLTLWPGPLVAVPALAMIGMGYGFISGSSAGTIGHYWNKNAFGHIASRLYIAWCIAAVSLPVLAGWLFDRTQGYGTAVMIAAGGNVLGALIAIGLPGRDDAPRGAAG